MLQDIIIMFLAGISIYLISYYITKSQILSFIVFCLYHAGLYMYFSFENKFFLGLWAFGGIVSVLLGLVLLGKQEKENEKRAVLKANKPSVIPNVFEGVFVSGAAGSGKTESVIYRVLQHYARYDFTGVIYDYKDFELTEIAYGLYENKDIPFRCISFHDVSRSNRINPIDPKYIENEDSLRTFFELIYDNITRSKDRENPFFKHAAVSAVSSLAWKLYEDDPNNCNIPFIVGLLTQKKIGDMAELITTNIRARSLGGAFLEALGSSETASNIKASISNFLNFFLTPEKFYVLSSDEFDLRINAPDHKAVVSVVNSPRDDSSYSPVLSSIIGLIVKQMSHRDRLNSFLLLDEAPTLKLQNASRIPATLRSYKVSTLYSIQDKSLSDELQGEAATRAMLANLSSMYIGKANDEKSARMYESFSELYKEKQKSTNQAANWIMSKGETRINISERERAKIRHSEFFKFKPGEFYNFCRGEEKKIKFPYKTPLRKKPGGVNLHTKKDLEERYMSQLEFCLKY